MNTWWLKLEIQNHVQLKNKHLGINLSKHVLNFYAKNDTVLMNIF